MTSRNWTTATPAIRVTRVFDAPRRLVQEVLTRPEHRRHWWGPAAAADAGARVTTTVTDEGGRTRVTVTILLAPHRTCSHLFAPVRTRS